MSHYNIYPTMMDAFIRIRDAEGMSSMRQRDQELLDIINRVPKATTEAMARGTMLNALVDSLVIGTPANEEMSVAIGTSKDGRRVWSTQLDGFAESWDEAFLYDLVDRVKTMAPQCYIEATMEVGTDEVKLYGYPDYIGAHHIVDLKTTKTYEVGKYRHHWQHVVYPWAVIAGGLMQQEDVDTFAYLVAELRTSKGVTSGEVYVEEYPVVFESCEDRLRDFFMYDLIPWIKGHESLITNTKIFEK